MLARKWAAWKRRQPSRIRYVMLPGPPRIAASGLVLTVIVRELRTPGSF